MGAFVYILKCADDSYYVGNTRKPVSERVLEHNEGKFGGYTASRRPVELAYSEYWDRLVDAFTRERQIKGWNRRKKEALIAGDVGKLRMLAKHPSVQRKAPQTPSTSRERDAPHPEARAQRASKD